ncbi:MAG: YciI family protein [Ilumatobacter sp.]|nr:YciI family protein [Ilumatobacter sp.]
MKYMLLIYGDPATELTEAEGEAMMTDYFAFTQRIVDSGEMVSGEPLQGAETATCVTVRDGASVVTDGTFAETKEVLGGYYLVDVESRDRAEELAAQIPTAKWGRIEVRPLMDLPEGPA